MPDFVVRKAAINDFLAIAKLDRESWGDEEINRHIPDGEHVWRLWVEHALVFCCYRNDEIAGAVLAFRTIEGSFVVHKFFVKNCERGMGCGKALLKEITKKLDSMAVNSFLTVDPKNEAAISMYKAVGYKGFTLHSDYYNRGESRLIAVRETGGK